MIIFLVKICLTFSLLCDIRIFINCEILTFKETVLKFISICIRTFILLIVISLC